MNVKTVHFIHIRKTGGSAIKHALSRVPSLDTPFGRIVVHRHDFGLRELPHDGICWFVVRDPVARFVSGFYSRFRKGLPLNDVPWSLEEEAAFGSYPTAHALADGLARDEENAHFAMRHIRHLMYPLSDWLVSAAFVRQHRKKILYVARQERLSADWARIRAILALPSYCALPDDPIAANRSPDQFASPLSSEGLAAVRRYYVGDYKILEALEALGLFGT